MSPNHAPPTFHRRRPSTLLLILSLALGLVAPTVVTAPASAQPAPQAADPLCWAGGWSDVPGPGRPYPLAWGNVGSRSFGGYTYRYWMVEEVRATSYYHSSYVAKCSGDLLISNTWINPTDGSGTAACTSTGDIIVGPLVSDRYVAQRNARYVHTNGGGVPPLVITYAFRYWLRVVSTGSTPPSGYGVRCWI
ncbi:hypothetical protein [Micromonospora rubida]